MILYYALGGGLGHLTRGRHVLDALGLAHDAAFITRSDYASDARITGRIPVIDHASMHEAVRNADRMIVDTFPCGIQGELSALDIPMDLVARRVRWREYRRAMPMPLPRFERVWCVEELEPEQLASLSAPVTPLSWTVPSTPAPLEPYWLIVHSGPEDEVRELVAYTQELQRLADPPTRTFVATRVAIELPAGFEIIDAYPASRLFPAATRIITAAGFNVMHETAPWRDKHHAVPFARRFDDQYWRAGSVAVLK
jgi:hypothetical protein